MDYGQVLAKQLAAWGSEGFKGTAWLRDGRTVTDIFELSVEGPLFYERSGALFFLNPGEIVAVGLEDCGGEQPFGVAS